MYDVAVPNSEKQTIILQNKIDTRKVNYQTIIS